MNLRWHDRTFGELSVVDLYAIVELRQRVFVVEQTCAYLDADGVDRVSRHVWAELEIPEPAAERATPKDAAASKPAKPSKAAKASAPAARGDGPDRPDGRDRSATPPASHRSGAEPRDGSDGIVAYLRIVPAGARFAEVSLGRIVTAPEVRRTGLGRTLVQRGLQAVGPVPVRIGAQAHLEPFYAEFGFRRASEPYLEDGIPHIEMLRA